MLTPYSSARSEYSGAAKLFLDANENPFDNGQNRYPDPLQSKLKTILSSIRNCTSDRIFIGNGSDEAIDLLIRLFCEPAKDHVLTTSPTYGMYKVSATINNVSVVDVPLEDGFSLPVEKILERTNEKTGIIFICSPNNPTGNAFPTDQILEVVDRSGTLVVVDEAYIDFSERESLIHLSNRPNLVVLQSYFWMPTKIHSITVKIATRIPFNPNSKQFFPPFATAHQIESLLETEVTKPLICSFGCSVNPPKTMY